MDQTELSDISVPPPPAAKSPLVAFHPVSDFQGWDAAPAWILNLIRQHASADVLEVGCGANPTISASVVSSLGIRYTANDISPEELDKADLAFERWVCDLSHASIPDAMHERFDLVFSRMVNEHVSDGRAYHANIYRLLKPGGIAAHCFSTLYGLPFLANRLLPESVGSLLLRLFAPRDSFKQGKFRAYYSWSRGPSPAMIARFEALGYSVLEYHGYFGHGYYNRVPPIARLEQLKARLLCQSPIPLLCSYGMLILKRN